LYAAVGNWTICSEIEHTENNPAKPPLVPFLGETFTGVCKGSQFIIVEKLK
jgi:hypothetical protein